MSASHKESYCGGPTSVHGQLEPERASQQRHARVCVCVCVWHSKSQQNLCFYFSFDLFPKLQSSLQLIKTNRPPHLEQLCFLFAALSAGSKNYQEPDSTGFNPQTAARVTCCRHQPQKQNKKSFQTMNNIGITYLEWFLHWKETERKHHL